MQKVPVRDREIKSYHEVLPKDARPEQGGRYLLSMNDEPTYVADITDFKGGCWAKVRVVETANEKYAHLYSKDMEFEIKVAHYGFHDVGDKALAVAPMVTPVEMRDGASVTDGPHDGGLPA
jgi:hypothetical protein